MERSPVDISVVIPAHNAEDTVARSVTSARSQVPCPTQVVVVDDGSTDGTAQVAREAGARVLCHPVSRGAAAARHTGVLATRTALVSFLDADDEQAPGYLAAVGAAHLAQPSASLVVGQSVEHHEDGPARHPFPFTDLELAQPVMALAWDNRIPTSAVTVPRPCYMRSGGFDPDFPGSAAEDYDLWLRLALLGPFARAPEAVVHRSIRRTSTSRRPEATQLMLRNGLLCVARNREAAQRAYPPFARVATAHVLREAALRCLDAHEEATAAALLLAALRSNPADARLWSACALRLVPPTLRPTLLKARLAWSSRRHQDHA